MIVRKNKILFGGKSAEDLIVNYGSPLYVYEYDTIVKQYNRLENAFKESPTSIYYACKANSNIELLKIFKNLGAGIDAVSPGEIFLAMQAGFSPDKILLTGTNLTEDDIQYAIDNDVRINIDNLSMVERYGHLFKGVDVSIRLNPDIRAGAHAYLETGHRDSKFGVLKQDIPRLVEMLHTNGARIVGVHQHIGSDILEADPIINGLSFILNIAKEIESVQFIDIGGGFKVSYFEKDTETDVDELGAHICEYFNSFCAENNRDLQLIIEPGKYLISEAGYLLTTVQSVKRNYQRVIVGTDTGMNHLIRPALYHAHHDILNASQVEGESERCYIVGNICESADVLGKNRTITRPNAGDVLCIKNAGSYGYSMSSMYNARLLPAEVLIQNDRAEIIRRRQRFDDLLTLFNDDSPD